MSFARFSLVAICLALLGAVRVDAATASCYCLTNAPARRVSRDLNRDGLADHAVIKDGHMLVRLSGRQGGLKWLATAERMHPAAIAAADIDRDGDADLVALSRRGSLHFWVNDGHGRFSEAHRAQLHRPGRFSLAVSSPQADSDRGRDPPGESPLETPRMPLSVGPTHARAPTPHGSSSAFLLSATVLQSPSRFARIPRAPPSVASL